MSIYAYDLPWQQPPTPEQHQAPIVQPLWPVFLLPRDEPLPWKLCRYPDGICVLCVQLPRRAGHADVFLSQEATWCWLGRDERAAHGEGHELIQLDWINPADGWRNAYFRLPDGAADLAVWWEDILQ